MTAPTLSLNQHAAPLVAQLCRDAERLRVAVHRGERGVTIVDAGIEVPGSLEAGLRVAEICLGGLGEVRLAAEARDGWPAWLQVRSSQPVLACLGGQYAGWSLAASKEETGGRKFFALGSGPARALAAKEDLYAELGYRDRCDTGVLVMEVALHRAHQLGFELHHIVEGSASAPLPAPSADMVQAMGRTNDAILYGGRVQLGVTGEADAARALALAMPSGNSRDFGRSFAELFVEAGHDFYKLDGALFAPAEVWVSHLASGRSWHAGRLDMGLLRRLWLEEAAA